VGAEGRAAADEPTVLLVEDVASLARVYCEFLRDEHCRVVHAATGSDALKLIDQLLPTVVLLDLNLPDIAGMDILKHVAEAALPCAVVVITAYGSVNVAVEAMRLGAQDFLIKPFNAERLKTTVRNTLERQRLARMVEAYRETFGRDHYHGFVGRSLAMQAVYRIIDSVASSRATVFITGESGTGKELCARAIHRQSPRRDRPFVALNCAAIPRDLMESEIFGHVKGAFTGALSDREGAATRADGGSLFLDEVCELDVNLQGKLLRFVQTGEFQRVGSSREETANIRFICATNRDPLAEVKAGRFREDLYYRLHVVPIALPALREREDDVLLLARHFLALYAHEEGRRFKGFSPEAEAALAAYPWPGNVRELQNVVRNVVVLHNDELAGFDMLPPSLHQPLPGPGHPAAPPAPKPASAPAGDAAGESGIVPLWQVEKDAIERAIALCEGNIPRAAALLGVNASTLYRKRLRWQEGG
jgi:DNA-binding NtrC family response regulator